MYVGGKYQENIESDQELPGVELRGVPIRKGWPAAVS
jgi:hypothetical protein